MDVFYEHLAQEQARIVDIMRLNVDMLPLTAEEQQRFDQAQGCPRCYETFVHGNEKVRHHNHRTGKFIDALCNNCNLQIGDRILIPVVFHNLKITTRITFLNRSTNASRRNTMRRVARRSKASTSSL
jgi:hypothetical protein